MGDLNDEDEHQPEDLISRFLEVAKDESPVAARGFLEAARWHLNDALELLFHAGDGDDRNDENELAGYGKLAERTKDVPLSAFAPVNLMFRGTYEMARREAEIENKWLLVNLQSPDERSSFILNKVTWRDEKVVDAVRGKFVFWQGDDSTEEGSRVRNLFSLESLPAVMVIEPFTGLNPLILDGMVPPEDLLIMLEAYLSVSPADYCIENDLDIRDVAASLFQRLNLNPSSLTPRPARP